MKTFAKEFETAGHPTSVKSETSAPYGYGGPFQEYFEAHMKQIKERHLEGLFVFKRGSDGGLVLITTQPTMSWVTAPTPLEPINQEKTIILVVPLEPIAESSARPIGTGAMAIVGG